MAEQLDSFLDVMTTMDVNDEGGQPAPVVIVGTGLGGYTVAREFRRLDPRTPLMLVSQDHAGFYSKPLLSNALASGKTAASLVMKPAARMAADLQATVTAHTRVSGLDPARRTLTLDSGQTVAYRDLVLALGADPLRPGLQGDAAEQMLCVNDLDDYARFSDRLAGVSTVAILGAGLIGCEFANDLLSRGIVPIVIDPARGPLSRLLPPQASQRLCDKLQSAGVRFHWEATATSLQHAEEGVLVLTLSNGRVLRAGLVLSAIGLRPRVALAQQAGLRVGQGIVTDERLATSAPHVYAVGDCAEVMGRNLPYVMPIMNQGRALAATLAGTPTAVVYPAMPIVVKTPACPVVACPPSLPQAEDRWHELVNQEGVEARCVGPDGSLLGFALVGEATSQKQSLAGQLRALDA